MIQSDDKGAKLSFQADRYFQTFDNLADFSEAVKMIAGRPLDLAAVLALNSDFVGNIGESLLLNVRGYHGEQPNNLLFLAEDKVYVFSATSLSVEWAKPFEEVVRKPFGRSTIATFLVLGRVLGTYKKRFEELLKRVRVLEDSFSHAEYRDLTRELERFGDWLEEFHELLLKLQERRFKQVETKYIAFDYSVLIAESLSLQGRCRRRESTLKDLREEHEMANTEELNQRIVKLNDVVKKLTAITVILMLPTLIASHFGMNFQFMPELAVWWAYPLVVVFQVVLMGLGYLMFRKAGWL